MMHLIPIDGPISPGNVVQVLDAVEYPSGRVLRPGRYTVERVEDRRVVVVARLDCSLLDNRFNPSVDGAGRRVTPLCGEPCAVYVEPGDYTAYASGDGPVTIPDLAPHA